MTNQQHTNSGHDIEPTTRALSQLCPQSQETIALLVRQLAELLLGHYPDEKPESLQHLDFAIAEFRDMKMQLSLERPLKHKEILGA